MCCSDGLFLHSAGQDKMDSDMLGLMHIHSCAHRGQLWANYPAAAWSGPVAVDLIQTLETPDCTQLQMVNSVIGHTAVCTSDRQLWFYSHNLLVTFKISPNSKHLPWNKLHYLGFKVFWLLQLRRLPDAFTCLVSSAKNKWLKYMRMEHSCVQIRITSSHIPDECFGLWLK